MLNTPLGIGIDAGNASVKIAVCDLYGQIVYSDYQLHKSQVVHTFQFMLNKIPSEITAQIKYGSACGVFANLISDSVENATESLIKGVQRIYPKAGCIAEIGSQTSQFIAGIKTGNIQFSSNKNCAAGTGSFFEDQMSRLGTKIEKYSEYVEKADRIPRLAGRCSVFAKTDIIHLQQDGEKIENILKGLAYSMVNNFRGTIIQTLPVDKPVFLAGGTSKNLGVVQAFKDVLKLDDEDLIVAEESSEIQAAGAASLAFEKRIKWNRGARRLDDGEGDRGRGDRALCENALAPLIDDYPTEDLHKTVPMVAGEPLFLGIDVGSTSTNFVLINQKNQVVDFQYFKTLGNTSATVQRGFDVLKERYGDRLNVINSGVTGSGRIMIGKKFNIPVVQDEITAQSTGTLFLNPECDTIFEIGGQDAKYISCKGGVTCDFAMNKVCSAGTGSFIEDQAERLGISAAELGMKALKSKKPALLDQRCTVFMKTSIENQLSNLKNNYGCVYMQTAARLVGDVLGLEKKGIKLLNPILQMDMGAPHMAVAMLKMGVLTLGKNPLKCKNALMKAGMALKQAQKKQEADGKHFLEKVAKEDKVLVLITRTYGLIDDVLNMGLPDLLLSRGCKVITLGNLEGHYVDIAKDYDNLYWPFSQHILSGAKIIKENPNLYAVYLTNHGCGPDTMISHLFAEIMGEKPYLQIEVDEHYSKVGLITRIEAFLSNLEKNQNKVYTEQNPKLLVSKNLDDLEKTLPVYIPHYNFISDFVAEGLQAEGYNAKVLLPTSRETLTLGKDNTTSKEYVTFTSLLGDVLKFAADNPKSDEEKQLLLFQTEGSETDGFYAQVIRSKLDQMGRTDIKIIAPKIEEMISADEKWFNIFWNAAKKTDMALNKQEITKNTGYSKILLTGDPLVMLNDACNSNFAEYFQSRIIKFGCSSLCEYLVFLWIDKINSKKTEDSKDGEKRLKLIKKDYSAVNDLQKIADKKFALLSGGNVRYRYAKHIAGQKNFGLVVEMDPMYENGTTILNMAHSHKIEKLPVFQIQFDGNPNADAMEQLEAFLKLSWSE